MTSTFLGIEMARRGLQANRLALDVTGHNVANAGTEGYTRQEVVLAASEALTPPVLGTSQSLVGNGVEVERVRRIRNEYLDRQVWDTSASLGYWQQNVETLQYAESVFPEPSSDGIQFSLVDFYNNWQELNNTPQDPGLKSVIWESARQLTTLFNQSYSQLKDIDDAIAQHSGGSVTGGRMQYMVGEVNSLVERLTELNSSIAKAVSLGSEPNDLLDKRDLLIDQLSEYGSLGVAQVTDGKNTGMVTLTFFGQALLKENNIPVILSVNIIDNTAPPVSYLAGNSEAVLIYNEGTATEKKVNLGSFEDGLSKGALAGLEKSRQEIQGFLDMMNRLAVSLAEEVNNIGPVKDLNSTGSNDFFTYGNDLGKAALNFDLSALVKSNANEIDGTKALLVANARYKEMNTLGGATFEQYYRRIISGVGAGLESCSLGKENQEVIKEQLNNLRESADGVNLDEEMTRMVQYQHSFAAAARVMSAVDEMLDLLINRLR